ncbi:hypothetical protein HSTV2_66 [Halorubrum sodomense tailed virus 2]|uniref:Uncharacterized protein n=1 Tax=Halorubrum sodomense tailed virus 2 TaxID=1262527 RepID=L7TK25_9CAUD|nr:hypothetical protein HSTV2_66 [Halorubrum sodomense tailed virus 2]AGC34335.1 hypothetical protein HSTV2_66 [Halorubrum sodomense tailed virus 2]
MPEYGFVVTVPNGDEQEYRTSGASLDAEAAVERCYSKYPQGRITRVLYGDVDDADLTPPGEEPDEAADEEDAEDDGDDATGVTESPLNPADFSVADLTEQMNARDLSVAELEALLEAEQADGDRTTAVSAIEDAIEDADE